MYLYLISIFIVIVFFLGIRIVYQYERSIHFRFGKYINILNPGFNWIIPIIDSTQKVDIRQIAIDMNAQEVLSKDNVNLKIDGLVFYSVEEPEKAVLNIENLRDQLQAKATAELKEIIGSMNMQDSLTKRELIGIKLMEMLNKAITDEEQKEKSKKKDWGIKVRGVQINNIELPKELVRAMAKTAEAEREKMARIIKADGELQASEKFSEAAKMYTNNPSALRLRELQTYQEIGTESNTLMMVIPETMANPTGNWLLSAGLKEATKLPEKKKNNI